MIQPHKYRSGEDLNSPLNTRALLVPLQCWRDVQSLPADPTMPPKALVPLSEEQTRGRATAISPHASSSYFSDKRQRIIHGYTAQGGNSTDKLNVNICTLR